MEEQRHLNKLESNTTDNRHIVNKAFYGNTRTDLELDAGTILEMYALEGTVTEMYAPHNISEMFYGGMVRQVNTEVVEAEGASPIFELPYPHEVRRPT